MAARTGTSQRGASSNGTALQNSDLMPSERPRQRHLPISTAGTILAVSNPCPIKLPHFDCSAMKLCPNGTTPSSLNCKLVLARSLSEEMYGIGPDSVILLKQNQTFASASTPLRSNVRGLVRKLLPVYGFFWMGNLGSNRFPELKLLRCRYPSELETRVGHKELHRSSA